MQNSDNITQIDLHVGQNIRERRTYLQKTQAELADSLGVSFQQLHKYEMGTNRVSASRLYQISKALDTPVAYFFFGLPNQNQTEIRDFEILQSELSKEAYQVHQIISSIKDEELKNKLIDFLKCLAK